MEMHEHGYLPALRFHSLTRFYDPIVRVTTREAEFKRRLLAQAAIDPGDRVLDLGCGTGTLAIAAKRAQPAAEVIGLDADADILERAHRKASAARLEIEFVRGLSTQLPFPDGSVNRVLATLFFHHLDAHAKRDTIEEVARVLRPGGELHVADWGAPAGALMSLLAWQIRLLDGLEPTRENLAGELPRLFESGGLRDSAETGQLATLFGTLCLYSARRRDR
jgi:ubiquinone/menaquinone biosynthesis C-methylase UbiE